MPTFISISRITPIFLLLISVFFSSPAHGQTSQDSLVTIQLNPSVFKFHSALEAKAFQQLEDHVDSDKLIFFMAADSLQTEDDYLKTSVILDSFSYQIIASGLLDKSPKKQMKKIYQSVHGTYLDKYTYENNFSSIFKDGQYNCVSGSALYASIFNRLDIPYAIQELPTHVLLVAYPKRDQIAIETTDPSGGYLIISDKMKREYAEYLRANKLISQEEFNQGYEIVFEQNYFDSRVIDLQQLAGIQYYNNALYDYDKVRYIKSRDNALKAYKLYPSDMNANVLISTVTTCLESDLGTNSDRIISYTIATNFLGHGIDTNYVLSHFEQTGINLLNQYKDTGSFKAIYNGLLSAAPDASFEHKVKLYYHFQMARYYNLQSNPKQYFNHAMHAYRLDSTKLDVEAMAINAMGEVTKYSSLAKSIKIVDSLVNIHPSLKANREIRSWLGNTYLEHFGNCYRDGNTKDAEKYRAQFEALAEGHTLPSLGVQNRNFEYAYNDGSVYYFKRGAYAKVNLLLTNAGKIAPENVFIKKLKVRYR